MAIRGRYKAHVLVNKIGPFASFIRPFTINGKETLVYATVDSLLGFEVGDLKTGKKLAHVEVEGWNMGPVRRHGNPSHGIALTPGEKELWLADGHNMRVHVFSAWISTLSLSISIDFASSAGVEQAEKSKVEIPKRTAN